MTHGRSRFGRLVSELATSTILLAAAGAFAQAPGKVIPDAQVESSVLRALAANPRTADQPIRSNSVSGVVTLSGSVPSETVRTQVETIASTTPGVQKVIDELTLAPGSTDAQTASDPSEGTNPRLQSDGTLAPNSAQQQAELPPTDQPSVDQPSSASHAAPSQSQASTPASGYPAPPSQTQRGYGDARQYPGGYGPPQNDDAQGSAQQAYGAPPSGDPSAYPRNSTAYPETRPEYRGQAAGRLVDVPSGTTLQVQLSQGLDSKNTPAGSTFDGIVVRDVIAGGAIAIPRGASVRGVVADAVQAGALKGRGELTLQLTHVSLGGTAYPITSDLWTAHGGNKTIQTVDSAVGLGALGAVIGAVAGGGAGAAIGAGVGGAAGIGSSAASGRGQVGLPPESVLSFRLTQLVQVATLSQSELNRLGYGVPAGQAPEMQRRYPGPYYGAGYGPGPYAPGLYGPGVYGPGVYGPGVYGPSYIYGPRVYAGRRFYPRRYRYYPY